MKHCQLALGFSKQKSIIAECEAVEIIDIKLNVIRFYRRCRKLRVSEILQL